MNKLYILMRTDIESMNPGKGMAQACHAANHCAAEMQTVGNYSEYQQNAFLQWEKQSSQDFGTTIVLDGETIEDVRYTIDCLTHSGVPCSIITDTSYPIRDGEVTHLINIDTCAWVFCCDEDSELVERVLGKYDLYY